MNFRTQIKSDAFGLKKYSKNTEKSKKNARKKRKKMLNKSQQMQEKQKNRKNTVGNSRLENFIPKLFIRKKNKKKITVTLN